MKIKRYITIRNSISADGLGVPSVSLYFSYCDKKDITGSFCPFCQNKDLQKDGIGYLLTVEEVKSILKPKIEYLQNTYGRCCIAFIGGEPLAQINRDFVIELAKYYKEQEVSTIVYTWREVHNLEKEEIDTTYFDRIVCGEYLEEYKDDSYILGSTNQYIINNKKEVTTGGNNASRN